MPAVCRVTDKCNHVSAPAITGSPNVFINGLAAHRKDDLWTPHTIDETVHAPKLSSGSTTVFVNGLQLGRIGDPISCGATVTTGSPDVFAGG